MKKNNSVLGVLVVLLSIVVLGLTGFIIYDKVLSEETKEKNTDINTANNKLEINEQEEDNVKLNYNADDYIELEDVVFNSKVSTKKVKLKKLNDNITKQFYEEQQKVIDNIHVSDSEFFNAEYDLKYFINNNILSILYKINESSEIGTCTSMMAVTNIDLKNNKVISEEELLKIAGTSYENIVKKYYDKDLESWNNVNESAGHEVSYYEVTYDDFTKNKTKYISDGLKKIPNIIYTYIEDGIIKYDYYTISVGSLFHAVGKGGCFNWATEELGNYN